MRTCEGDVDALRAIDTLPAVAGYSHDLFGIENH